VRALAVIVAVPCGLLGGLVVGFAWGILTGSVVPDGLLPLLMCPLGGWVAGYGTWTLIGPRPRRGFA
jgi:hypothetical protein